MGVYSSLHFWQGFSSASFYRTDTFLNFLCSNQVIKPIILANTSDSPSTWHLHWHPTFLHLTHTVYLWFSSYSQKTSNPQTKKSSLCKWNRTCFWEVVSEFLSSISMNARPRRVNFFATRSLFVLFHCFFYFVEVINILHRINSN